MKGVKQQYEYYPYPPIPVMALPRRDSGRPLRYEYGCALQQATDDKKSHHDKRILVVGGGTLEPLVVAQQHPYACEIVVVEISTVSLRRLRWRIAFARVRDGVYLRWWRGRRLPPIRLVDADIHDFHEPDFDYIIASNVLHHVEAPEKLLCHLATLLNKDGLMRMVTYARASRIWLRAVGEWLRLHGIGPYQRGIKTRAHRLMRQLPRKHPLRNAFFAHNESNSSTGIVDAFLHECERPLSPRQWATAVADAGLCLIGEDQAWMSQSGFVKEFVPELASVDTWQGLQILDDSLELSANPVLWMYKGQASPVTMHDAPADEYEKVSIKPLSTFSGSHFQLPSEIYWRLGCLLRTLAEELKLHGLSLNTYLARLDSAIDGHWYGTDAEQRIYGVRLVDYDIEALLAASAPWSSEQWQQLQDGMGESYRVYFQDKPVMGDTLMQQARYLQLRYGPEMAMIEIEIKKERPGNPGRGV